MVLIKRTGTQQNQVTGGKTPVTCIGEMLALFPDQDQKGLLCVIKRAFLAPEGISDVLPGRLPTPPAPRTPRPAWSLASLDPTPQ